MRRALSSHHLTPRVVVLTPSHTSHRQEGKPHPDPVVETSTLAAVSPPLPTYQHHLQDAVASGALSNLQIESIIYAFQRFQHHLDDGSRMGFMLGDGAGVGKGRQIAGAAYEHWRTGGRRVLWVSVNSDLRIDAQRDMADLGLEPIPIYPPRDNKTGTVPPGNLDSAGWKDGVLFFTYSLLVSNSAKHGTRLQQVINWLKRDSSGTPLIIWDECHKAKNFNPGKKDGEDKSSKTAKVCVELQEALPEARVLYASATGASSPSNLAYCVRLGLFGMPSFKALLDSLNRSGLGSMELFCMGLKSVGAYMCRTLSYSGAEFELCTVPLSPAIRQMYDRTCSFWCLLFRVFETVFSHIGQSKKARLRMGQFWGAHQRCFRQLILSAKVPKLASMAVDAVTNKNMAVVIGLQSTGESNMRSATADNDDEAFDDWISTPQVVITNLLKSQLPTQYEAEVGVIPYDFRPLYLEIVSVVKAWKTLAPVSTEVEGDDDDVQIVAEKSLDEVEAEKLERAKLEGMYIDLTTAKPVSDKDIADAEADAKAASKQAEQLVEVRRKADLERLKKERAAVRAVAGEAEVVDEDEDMPLAGGGIGPERLIGRSIIRGSGRSLDSGTILRYEAETLLSDSPIFVVKWLSAGLQELSESEILPLLVADSDPDEPVEDVRARKGKATAQAAAPAKAKPQGGTMTVGGRSLRAGARIARVAVVESSDSDASDEDDSDASGDDSDSDSDVEIVSGGSDGSEDSDMSDEEVPVARKRKASGPPPSSRAKAAPSKLRIVSDGEDEEDEEPDIMPKSKSAVKSEFAAAAPKPVAAAVAAAPSAKMRAKFELDDDEAYEDDEDGDPYANGKLVTDPWLVKIRDALLEAAASLELPPCPLDHLLDLCGGVDKVAEMTGRKERMLRESNGKVTVVRRNNNVDCSMKQLNLHERNAFQDGTKLIAIISEAASTGISLQADKRMGNTRRRLHLTLELSWSADKAIQQFGRSHRSNQSSAPIYRILVTPLGGERRFAASAAKRLSSLGALMRGDRKALGAGVALKAFDIMNRWGSEALSRTFEDLCGYSDPMAGVTVPGGDLQAFRAAARKALVSVGIARWAGYAYPSAIQNGTAPIMIDGIRDGGFSKKVRGDSGDGLSRFLNRLLGVDVQMQSDLFSYFSETFDARIQVAKTSGAWDDGVVSLKSESLKVAPGFPSRIHTCPVSGAETHVLELDLDRGVSFDSALQRLRQAESDWVSAGRVWDSNMCGFYKVSGQTALGTGKPHVGLFTEIWTGATSTAHTRVRKCYKFVKPNIGLQVARWADDIENNYEKISEAEAKKLWSFWFDYYATHCGHGDKCSRRRDGYDCSYGTRTSKERLVIGACLPVWALVCDCVKVTSKHDSEEAGDMRVVRCSTDSGHTFVGLHLKSDTQMRKLIGAVEAADAAPAMFADADDDELDAY